MKKLILILIVAVGFTACKKNELFRPITESPSTSAPVIKVYDKWRVTLLVNDGTDETANFRGYTFQFIPNGTLIASQNGVNTIGHWSNRTESDQPKFNINFDSGPLMELNNNWDHKLTHTNIIQLEYITKNDVTEYLNFQKIR